MNVPALRKWLAQPRTALAGAVAAGVREHVAALRSQGAEFYGYALLPGDPGDFRSLVAVTNSAADIEVPSDHDQYRYYRYSVDEWAHWHHDGFAEANRLLTDLNEQFRSMHSKDDDDCQMDKFEVAHANTLLDAIVRGLDTAKQSGAFGGEELFLAVWISDCGNRIVHESVRCLNSKSVADEFAAEFG